jgi:hypothetical protein
MKEEGSGLPGLLSFRIACLDNAAGLSKPSPVPWKDAPPREVSYNMCTQGSARDRRRHNHNSRCGGRHFGGISKIGIV